MWRFLCVNRLGDQAIGGKPADHCADQTRDCPNEHQNDPAQETCDDQEGNGKVFHRLTMQRKVGAIVILSHAGNPKPVTS